MSEFLRKGKLEAMTQQELLAEFTALPNEAQRQVADFVARLHRKYRPAKPNPPINAATPASSFIGMWRDREDMADSTSWVRETRKTEWSS